MCLIYKTKRVGKKRKTTINVTKMHYKASLLFNFYLGDILIWPLVWLPREVVVTGVVVYRWSKIGSLFIVGKLPVIPLPGCCRKLAGVEGKFCKELLLILLKLLELASSLCIEFSFKSLSTLQSLLQSSGRGFTNDSFKSNKLMRLWSSPMAIWWPLALHLILFKAGVPSMTMDALGTSVSLMRFQRSRRPVPSAHANTAGLIGDHWTS